MRSDGVESKMNWITLGEGSNLSQVLLDDVVSFEACDMDAAVFGIAIVKEDGSTEYVRYSNELNRDLELLRLRQVVRLQGETKQVTIELIRERGTKYEPESTTITRMTYHEPSQQMIVDFKTGGSYLYFEVPVGTWLAILDAESAGKAFHERIKKAGIRWEKVEAIEAEVQHEGV